MLVRRGLIGFLSALVVLHMPPVAAADPAGGAGATARKVYLFNIPAQPLQSALVTYINVVGNQIIYDSKLARNHRSSPVVGLFTADSALRMLLDGSDLTIVSTGTQDISLVSMSRNAAGALVDETGGAEMTMVLDTLHVDVPPGAEQRPDFSEYGRLVRQEIKRALTQSPETAQRIYDVRLEIRVDSRGCMQKPSFTQSSGKADLDAAIQRVLAAIVLKAPPPVGMPQPIRVALLGI